MDTKFGMSVCNRKLLNATKFQGYSFYLFWVIKGNPTRGGKIILPPTTQIMKRISEGEVEFLLKSQRYLRQLSEIFFRQFPQQS